MKEIDARKLACPTPVLLTREAIETESPAAITVIVDNEASHQNVSRFLASKAYTTRIENVGTYFHVIGTREEGSVLPAPVQSVQPEAPPSEERKILVMIATDRIGFGDDVLGSRLMVNFVKTLKEMGRELWRLVLVNNGVKLAVKGSEVLDSLKALDADGIKIMVCGTCLEHYRLMERKQIGETTNMLDIVTAMQLADKVINL